MKIRNIDLSDSKLKQEHDELGLPPPEKSLADAQLHPWLHVLTAIVMMIVLVMVGYFMSRLFGNGYESGKAIIIDAINSRVFWSALGVGLLAQIIDGALGMAYGVTASTFLLATGSSPAIATGATHLAEVFTTGVSGVAHARLGNVNRRLFLSLLLPGVIGAAMGAFLVTYIDGKVLKPYVTIYLLCMGLYVFSKAFRHVQVRKDIQPSKIAPLAWFGGFMDAAGGGGWGPIVTSSLVGNGHDPRTTIGSVNLAEFFLTISTAVTFITLLDGQVWLTVAGLVIGGVFAAPFAAYATKFFSTRTLLILVGLLISIVSVFNLYKYLMD